MVSRVDGHLWSQGCTWEVGSVRVYCQELTLGKVPNLAGILHGSFPYMVHVILESARVACGTPTHPPPHMHT